MCSHYDKAQRSESSFSSAAGSTTAVFFAPSWFKQRLSDLGASALFGSMVEYWWSFLKSTKCYTKWKRVYGVDEFVRAFVGMVSAGTVDPAEGIVCSLESEGEEEEGSWVRVEKMMKAISNQRSAPRTVSNI